jgi:hypothetical protein
VFEQEDLIAERGPDPLSLALKEPRPLRVVFDDVDRTGLWYYLSHMGRPDLLIS